MTNSILAFTPAAQAQPQSYAAAQNAKYSNTESNYVDMKDRINSVIGALPSLKQAGVRSAMLDACQKWMSRFSKVKKTPIRWPPLTRTRFHAFTASERFAGLTAQKQVCSKITSKD